MGQLGRILLSGSSGSSGVFSGCALLAGGAPDSASSADFGETLDFTGASNLSDVSGFALTSDASRPAGFSIAPDAASDGNDARCDLSKASRADC